MTALPDQSTPSHRPQAVPWALLLVVAAAVVVRLLMLQGAFGSDDLSYFDRAVEIARGEWSCADYNGALRYGFNLPAALFVALFGEHIQAAIVWPLLCSVIEVVAVYAFGRAAMGQRAGLCAAVLLAMSPLHIAVSTRVHADSVVAMFITVGFVLVFFGARQQRPGLLFSAGLFIGAIFWAKELAAVTWFAYLPMLYLFQGRFRRLWPVVGGTVLMLVLHGLLMQSLAGDPLHLVKVVLSALKSNFVDGGQGEDSAVYYLRFLFLDVRHTGLLGFLAVAAVAVVPRWAQRTGASVDGYRFVLVWWLSLLLVMSLFPVSLSPLRLTMKQSNYLGLFMAPMAILAGMVLASLPPAACRWLLLLCSALGLLLAAFQQADWRMFTANSKALGAMATEYPQAVIVGSTNNSAMGSFWAAQTHPGKPAAPIYSFRDHVDGRKRSAGAGMCPPAAAAVDEAASPVGVPQVAGLTDDGGLRDSLGKADAVLVVLDRQTMHWYAGTAPVLQPLPCWTHVRRLDPVGLGLGNALAAQAGAAFASVPRLSRFFDGLARPQPADVYRVQGHDLLCRSG